MPRTLMSCDSYVTMCIYLAGDGQVTLVLSKLLVELDHMVNLLQRCLPVDLLKCDES